MSRTVLADHHDSHHVRHDDPHTGPEGRRAPDAVRACLLVAPAPINADNRDQLAHTLTTLHPAPAAALLFGPWPHGATLDLDENHHVLAHHPVPTQHNTDLTGYQLHPTNPAQLTDALLHPLPPTTGTGTGLRLGPGASATPDDRIVTEPDNVVYDNDDSSGDSSGDSSDDSSDVVEVGGRKTELDVQNHDDHDRDDASQASRAEAGDQAVTAPLALSVFGPIELYHQPDEPPDGAGAGTASDEPPARVKITRLPRLARELLAYLAAHPEGVRRGTLIDQLCPDRAPDAKRGDGALHTALSRLRSRITEITGNDSLDTIVVSDGTRWMLNPDVVTVDSWDLLATSAPHRPTTPDRRRRDLHAVVAAYRGLFAADLPATWAHDFRVSASVRYREIVVDLAEIEVSRRNDATALDLLERARRVERNNEKIYRSIIRIHLRNDRTDDARATFELLRTYLAEIDAEPETETRLLIPIEAS